MFVFACPGLVAAFIDIVFGRTIAFLLCVMPATELSLAVVW